MNYDFEVRAGNTGTVQNEVGLELVVKEGKPAVPVNLSGSEIVFAARAAPNTPVLLRKTSANGGITVTAEEGRIIVPFTKQETRLLRGNATGPFLLLQYEVERRVPATGTERTILSGKIKVLAGVNDD